MKSLLIFLTLCVAGSLKAAIQIDVTTAGAGFGSGIPVRDSEGGLVPAGNRILVGSFNTGPEAGSFFTTNAFKFGNLYSAFTPISSGFELGTLGNRDAVFYEPGEIDTFGKVAALPSPLDLGLTASTPIYLWILQTDDNGSDIATDFSNVLAHGIFSSNEPHWTFFDGNPLANNLLRTTEIDLFFVSGNNDLSLAAIPEPSVMGLFTGFIAMLGAFRRRR